MRLEQHNNREYMMNDEGSKITFNHKNEGGQLSQSSVKSYTAVIRQIMDANREKKLDEYLNRTRTRGGYFKLVAAVKYLGSGNEVQQKNSEALLNMIKKPDFEKRKSKVQQNYRLQTGWRDEFLNRIEKNETEYKAHLLIGLLTGIRPAEFEKTVQIYADETSIKIKIAGVKIKEKDGVIEQGMEWRSLAFKRPSQDRAIDMLLNELKIDRGQAYVSLGGLNTIDSTDYTTMKQHKSGFIGTMRGMEGAAQRLGRGLIKQKKGSFEQENFSFYNLRHNFGSVLKSSGIARIDISRALGHISMRTMLYYGRPVKNYSHGYLAPEKITSSHKPRQMTFELPPKSRPDKHSKTKVITEKTKTIRPR
jgi:integrase